MVFCVFISKCEILIYGFEISQPTRQMPIKSTAHMRITYAFINQLMTCRFYLMFAIQFARFFSFFFWIVILLWSLSRYDRILIQLLSQLIRIKSLSLYPSLRPFFPFLSLRNSNHIAFCRFTKTLNGSKRRKETIAGMQQITIAHRTKNITELHFIQLFHFSRTSLWFFDLMLNFR